MTLRASLAHNRDVATNTTINPKQQAHDRVARAAAMARSDDEPANAEDARRIREGQVWFAQGKGIPMEEVLSEFGLTMEDFPMGTISSLG